MSSIRRRTWTASSGEKKSAWQVDYRDTRGHRRSKQFHRKKDAEAWLTQAAWQVTQGTHTPDSQSVTVKQAGNIWIAKAGADRLERATIENYRRVLDRHIVPFIGAERLSRLTMPAVRAFADDLLKNRSRPTATRALHHLRMILTEAQRRGLVAQNVAAGVRIGKAAREKEPVVIPSKAELQAMINASDDNLRPLVITAIFTGLRASELRGLRWSDVDLKKGTVTVSQRADRFNVIGPPKSAAGWRTIPLPPVAVTELKKWKLACPNSELGLAFPAKEGGVLHYRNFMRRQFHPMQIAAGVIVDTGKTDANGAPIVEAKYSLHALRHAAASAWIKQRIDLKRLQSWMGHSSIQVTLNIYGHLIEDDSGDAALAAAAQRELLGA
jgi:integrase